MSIIVQKYGGSSVADPPKLRRVAERIVATRRQGHDLVVVVSAMGRTTDDLMSLARSISRDPDRRELDMLLTAGERMAMTLLAMAIKELGEDAISFTGSQSGIITNDRHFDARILEVRPFRIQDELDRGRIVIVAGYQGVSYRREVTTLGRGGSDTTAVALAAALGAERCEIYSDVDGVYSADPREVAGARHVPLLEYEEMQEMAEAGARILHAGCVEIAKRAGIALYARATGGGGETVVRRLVPPPEARVVGVVSSRHMAIVSSTRGCSAARAQEALDVADDLGLTPREVRYRGGAEGHVELVLSLADVPAGAECARLLGEALPDFAIEQDLAAVSVIGTGINATFRNTRRAWSRVHHCRALSTSSFRITFIVPDGDRRALQQELHQIFVEDRAGADVA